MLKSMFSSTPTWSHWIVVNSRWFRFFTKIQSDPTVEGRDEMTYDTSYQDQICFLQLTCLSNWSLKWKALVPPGGRSGSAVEQLPTAAGSNQESPITRPLQQGPWWVLLLILFICLRPIRVVLIDCITVDGQEGWGLTWQLTVQTHIVSQGDSLHPPLAWRETVKMRGCNLQLDHQLSLDPQHRAFLHSWDATSFPAARGTATNSEELRVSNLQVQSESSNSICTDTQPWDEPSQSQFIWIVWLITLKSNMIPPGFGACRLLIVMNKLVSCTFDWVIS